MAGSLAGLLLLAPAVAVAGPLGGLGTATVDGVITAAEWAGAARLDVVVSTWTGQRSASLFVMNDADRLYVALRVRQPELLYSSVWLGLDTDRNGTCLDPGEDALVLTTGLGVSDQVWTSAGAIADVLLGGSEDGEGAATHHGAYSDYELGRPLASADPFDAALRVGDAFRLVVWTRLGCTPTACADTSFDPTFVVRAAPGS